MLLIEKDPICPKLHSLLQNDNLENLELISQREARYFKLTARLPRSDTALEIFLAQFSLIVRI